MDRDQDIEFEIPFWAKREAIYVDLNTNERIDNRTYVNYQEGELL